MPNFSLASTERLKSKKELGELFAHGKSFLLYPFKIVYHTPSQKTEARSKVAFAVSKKKLKNAVDRNRMKRLMREGYRLNKHVLTNHLSQSDKWLNITFIYLRNDLASQLEVSDKIKLILHRLAQAA